MKKGRLSNIYIALFELSVFVLEKYNEEDKDK